jgi:anti-anti-sigma factor
MSASLDVHMLMVDGRCVIRLIGEVDLSTASQLADALEEAHGTIEINCAELRFIDAAGLGVLARAASTNGSLAMRGATSFVRRTVRAAGLEQLLATNER